jgi:hypothetical protein
MKSMIKGRRSIAAAKKKSTVDYRMPLADYHPNHDKHLCKMVELRNMKTVGKLAKDAQYICFLCGRAARNKTNLCEPVEL